MSRKAIFSLICFGSLAVAQSTQQITITSAASASVGLAPESLATATGMNLATQTAIAFTVPWPTTLGGVTIQVVDSASVSRPAGLLYVSPNQINFEVPAGTALGPATVMMNPGGSAAVQIMPVATGLFSLNSDIAAATAVRLLVGSQIQSPVAVFQCQFSSLSCSLVPIDVGIDTPVYLSFYGTGLRGRSALSNVTVTIGTVTIPAQYAGPQPQFPGLDQLNVPLCTIVAGRWCRECDRHGGRSNFEPSNDPSDVTGRRR